MNEKCKIGVVGSTGYTGASLLTLLINHPYVEISYLSSESYIGKKYSDIYPAFKGKLDLKCKETNAKNIAKACDIVFCATPHGFSEEFIPKLLKEKKDLKIIDLSADFRLNNDIKINKSKYKIIYGLPELYREEIKSAQVIANPGCYPTSIILGIAPALKNNLIKVDSIIADSKSGVSGAGRQAKKELLFTELNESFSAYKLAGEHRHIPEIENELGKLFKQKTTPKITFSPHLLPINRGILSTIYADLKGTITGEKLTSIYKDFYKEEPFVAVFTDDIYPSIKDVRNSNYCYIMPIIDKRTNKLIVVSCIDNMIKGASGQAIQNMNIMLGIKENTALDNIANVP